MARLWPAVPASEGRRYRNYDRLSARRRRCRADFARALLLRFGDLYRNREAQSAAIAR